MRREMLIRSGEDLITRFASKYEKATNAILAANAIGLIPPPDDEDPSGDLATGLDNLDVVSSILNYKGALVGPGAKPVDIKQLFSLKKKVIGLYFSAQWLVFSHLHIQIQLLFNHC
jgi:hypothetical protein